MKNDKGRLASGLSSENFEYDFGPSAFTGEIASPYINKVLDNIFDKAFPDGLNAYRKNQTAKAAKK